MILITAYQHDQLAAALYRYLRQEGLPVLLLDEKQITPRVGVSWMPHRAGEVNLLHIEDETIPLESVTGVFARVDPRAPAGGGSPEPMSGDAVYIQSEFAAMLLGLLHALGDRVINRPQLCPSEMSILLQAASRGALQAGGLKLVPIDFACSEEGLSQQGEKHAGPRMIGLIDGSTPPLLLHDEGLPARVKELLLQEIRPVYMQRLPAGEPVRVCVVGETAVAASGWGSRVVGGEAGGVAAADVPQSVQEACIELASQAGYVFAEVGLVRTASGVWSCWGLNPHPTPLDYGPELEQIIIAALAERLAGRREAAR